MIMSNCSHHHKLCKLINQTKVYLDDNNGKPTRSSLWRAYVSLEYAILDLKLRYNVQENSISKIEIKNKGVVNKSSDGNLYKENYIKIVKLKLEKADLLDRKVLLSELRLCRDLLKNLVTKLS
jgi:hypothetical protein